MKNQKTFKLNLLKSLPRLRRYALSLAASEHDADDLLQATAERALTRWEQLNCDSKPDRWLFTIMSSIWKNELRANAIRQGQGFVDPDSLTSSMDSNTEYADEYRDVVNRVRKLPEGQRQVVYLVYVEGFKYEEAARILGIAGGTVMSRLARARLALSQPVQSPLVAGIRS